MHILFNLSYIHLSINLYMIIIIIICQIQIQMTDHPNKISRLDQLLSRNEIIYKNLRSKLQEISQSNQNIDANINYIKPLYTEYDDDDRYHENCQSNITGSSQIQSEYKMRDNQNSRQFEEIVSPKFHELNSNLLEKNLDDYGSRETERNKGYYYENLEAESEDGDEKIHHQSSQYIKHQHTFNYRQKQSDKYAQKQSQQSFKKQQQKSSKKLTYTNEKQQIQNQPIVQNIYSTNRFTNQSLTFENNRMLIQQKQKQLLCSYIFVPFNKLFKSPTMTLKKHNQLIVARQSKTKIVSHLQSTRIIDGIKIKNNHIYTEEHQLLKDLENCHTKDGVRKIGFVGGSQALKKKLHIDVISYIYTILTEIVTNKQSGQKVEFFIEHQQAVTGKDAQIIQQQFSFSHDMAVNKFNLVSLSSFLQDIFILMKKRLVSNDKKIVNRIRVTKTTLLIDSQLIQKTVIMSSNKVQSEFIMSLGLSKIIWCLNPLYKYHEESLNVLEQMKKVEKKVEYQKRTLNKVPTFKCTNQYEFNPLYKGKK